MNVIDLSRERRIRAIIQRIADRFASNPALARRTKALLNEDIPTMKQAPISIRLSDLLIKRLDSLADKLNSDPERGLSRPYSRADAMREAMARGLKELERDLEKTAKRERQERPQ